MNRFDVVEKYLISKDKDKIEKIKNYSINLDDRSYITLVSEIFNSFCKARGDVFYNSFSSIPDVKFYSENEYPESKLSLENVCDLIRSLNLENNDGWDLYREEYFINFIKNIYNKISKTDQINFLLFLDSYNLFIKNEIEYFDVNLLQFFNFPNFKVHCKKSDKKDLFYIQLEKFILNNTINIISANLMDKFFSFGNFRIDERVLLENIKKDKTFLQYSTDKICDDVDLSEIKKQELLETLLNFYASYNFYISKTEDKYLIENKHIYVRNSFFSVFQNKMGSLVLPNNTGNYFSMKKAKEAKMKRILNSV